MHTLEGKLGIRFRLLHPTQGNSDNEYVTECILQREPQLRTLGSFQNFAYVGDRFHFSTKVCAVIIIIIIIIITAEQIFCTAKQKFHQSTNYARLLKQNNNNEKKYHNTDLQK